MSPEILFKQFYIYFLKNKWKQHSILFLLILSTFPDWSLTEGHCLSQLLWMPGIPWEIMTAQQGKRCQQFPKLSHISFSPVIDNIASEAGASALYSVRPCEWLCDLQQVT